MPTSLSCRPFAGEGLTAEVADNILGGRQAAGAGQEGGSNSGGGADSDACGGSGSAAYGSGTWTDYYSVSRLAANEEITAIKMARGALLRWIAENSGRLAVVQQGGQVEVSFRLNPEHPAACRANGTWNTMKITVPAKS